MAQWSRRTYKIAKEATKEAMTYLRALHSAKDVLLRACLSVIVHWFPKTPIPRSPITN